MLGDFHERIVMIGAFIGLSAGIGLTRRRR
jgi:hypothetical protein